MKKLILFALICALFIASTTVNAAERASLGFSNIAIKVDYIDFTDGVLEDSNVDSGVYVGIEGYGGITPNVYIGGEVGYANPDGSVNISGSTRDNEVTYIPLELNIKYALSEVPNLLFDIGAGTSINYIKEKSTVSGVTATADDWLYGGQIFIDLIYISDIFFTGIHGKFQVTEDFNASSYDYTNWRIGGQVGIIF